MFVSVPRLLAFFTLAVLTGGALMANVTPSPLFADHAVLQRGKPFPVFGTGTPGEKVTVVFQGQTVHTTADAQGRWLALLEPLTASSTPAELTIKGKNEIVLRDVLVGEVWLCSGQSNMEFSVAQARDVAADIAAANQPLIRHLKVDKAVAGAPATTFATSGWVAATPQTVGAFTAVGYFFARDLQRRLGVPIGLINTTWGGTQIESWLSDHTLRSSPHFAVIDSRWQADVALATPERIARYPADYAAWEKAEAQARATKTKNPLAWPKPLATPDSPARPSGLFNAMIAPLQPYAIAGFLWYQGESNVGRAAEYAQLFPALISAWRDNWGDAELPFYFVQLANYGDNGNPAGRAWAELREAQTRALTLPATGMAVTIDIGERDDIHPTNKQEVGRRLALLARNRTYGLPCDDSGPEFLRVERAGSALRIHLALADHGLTAAGKPSQAFEIAGADHRFHPATVKLERNTLLVSAPEVKDPVAVRYAWFNAPVANIYNGAGLPAAPFRSDSW